MKLHLELSIALFNIISISPCTIDTQTYSDSCSLMCISAFRQCRPYGDKINMENCPKIHWVNSSKFQDFSCLFLVSHCKSNFEEQFVVSFGWRFANFYHETHYSLSCKMLIELEAWVLHVGDCSWRSVFTECCHVADHASILGQCGIISTSKIKISGLSLQSVSLECLIDGWILFFDEGNDTNV